LETKNPESRVEAKEDLGKRNRVAAAMVEKGKSRRNDVVTREYTINLHRRLHGW